ncbi:DUF4347 domain-containing protein [Oscillatoriales cyanobacterium LEGE 11467]|uniref:DUF4347 domain-containing protein n=1 Tax=Zarconia navalis LEGE 11467 TaxID=1828826 RepID=A0A928Z694_9CYAN|nr:DUF4347 domain-containing protein [Zarconia navalis]MBE9040132.1 DUF4347 domain-containing protein [Zarconia navalis LEGE 11467]
MLNNQGVNPHRSSKSIDFGVAWPQLRKLPSDFTESPSAAIDQIVFIDGAIEDCQTLLTHLESQVDIIVLEKQQDGVDRITEILDRRCHLRGIHIISHGSPGTIELGNAQLRWDNLETYRDRLQRWTTNCSGLLPPFIFLYGCHVAAGKIGQAFIEQLCHLTGAIVAASASPMGDVGAQNWSLELPPGLPGTESRSPDRLQPSVTIVENT